MNFSLTAFFQNHFSEPIGLVRRTHPIGSWKSLFAALAIFVVAGSSADAQTRRFEFRFGNQAQPAKKAEVSVQSGALVKRVALGEQGTFVITVNNGKPTNIPQTITAEGLQIAQTGQQFMGSFGAQKYLYTFAFVGMKEGEFIIPAFEIDVRGEKFKTNPETITIFKRKPGDLTLDASKPYFVQLKTELTEIYENQMVPLTLTAFVRGQGAVHEVGSPKLSHDAVVFRKFKETTIGARDVGGAIFTTAILPSALFALKEGVHTIGPAQLSARIYESSGFGGRSLFTMTTVKRMASNSLKLTVKPLPPGAPKSFTGGVGNFELTVTASPTVVTAGDPISLEFEVKGVGNFETMEAPVFTALNPADWRTYDARKIVDPAENSDGATEGRATFSQIVIPKTQASTIPSFELTFFDPKAAKYVTRTTAPIPIVVKSDPRANQAQAVISSVGGQSGASETPSASKPEAKYNDILTIKSTKPKWRDLPVAATSQPIFWVGQAVPSLALFTLMGLGVARLISRRTRKDKSTDGERISFSQAAAAIPGANAERPDFYRAVKTALDAWEHETSDAKRERLALETMRAVKALDSRCEWLLYGAEEEKREGRVSERETAETQEILRRLGPLPAKAAKAKTRAEKPAKKDSNTDALGF